MRGQEEGAGTALHPASSAEQKDMQLVAHKTSDISSKPLLSQFHCLNSQPAQKLVIQMRESPMDPAKDCAT
jgi:hypothetical protein